MTTNEQAPTGGERIKRAMEFYRPIVEQLEKLTDAEAARFSITETIQSKIDGLTEDEALEIFTDLKVLAESLDIFGTAFGLAGKAKYQKGASNVS